MHTYEGLLPMSKIDGLLSEESGATAIEYGLIAALVAVILIAALVALGSQLSTLFSGIANDL